MVSDKEKEAAEKFIEKINEEAGRLKIDQLLTALVVEDHLLFNLNGSPNFMKGVIKAMLESLTIAPTATSIETQQMFGKVIVEVGKLIGLDNIIIITGKDSGVDDEECWLTRSCSSLFAFTSMEPILKSEEVLKGKVKEKQTESNGGEIEEIFH